MPLRDLLWRLGVLGAAVVSVLVDAPRAVVCVLVAAAALAVAHAGVRRRRAGGIDAVLVGTGTVLAVLVVTGVGLDLAGVRLRPTSWALALGVVGAGCLLASWRRAPEAPTAIAVGALRRRDVPWFVASAAVVALAVTMSVRSVASVDEPPVAMSVGSERGAGVDVLLTSGEDAGPYELRTQAGDGNEISYPLVSLRAGVPLTTTVFLPTKGRYVITLNNPGQDAPVRTLTVDR